MAGGGGTRLFPLSQKGEGRLPKQFLSVIDSETLLQKSILRVPAEYDVCVIPEEVYTGTVLEQSRQIDRQVTVISEPFGCNTAAAILYVSALALPEDGILCFIPADHEMDAEIFERLLRDAVALAEEQSKVITIGITPAGPETNYGYIKTLEGDGGISLPVEQFVEKPDLEKAREYIADGGYYWNAGIFAAKASVFIDNARKQCPRILEPLLEAADQQSPMTQKKAYEFIKEQRLNKSIDYALMEKIADEMLLVPAPSELDWNDLGNFEALQRYMVPDARDNRAFSETEVHFDGSDSVSVCNYTDNPVFIREMDHVLVVVTDQGILIRPKSTGSNE